MPPKQIPSKVQQQPQQPQQTPQNRSAPKNAKKARPAATDAKPTVPDDEVKKHSSMSAQLALEAAKKAYELRQAAYGAGDPNAREEILAKAVNKEIEAESFGKAAKYTRSGAFQGLAAGAGLGVQPGATLGKLTGALVGGLVSTVGALVGGGIGSAYGAINGPMWDLGQMASQGVRSIVGDFPNWQATPSQKKALEKMVMQAQQTKAPDQEELEEMRADDGGADQADYQQFTNELSSWIPSMPSMPSTKSIPGVSQLSSFVGFGGQPEATKPTSTQKKAPVAPKANQSQTPKAAPKPTTKPKALSESQGAAPKATAQSTVQTRSQSTNQSAKPQQAPKVEEAAVKRKPKKLEVRSADTTPQPEQAPARRKPPKLEPRRKPAAASA